MKVVTHSGPFHADDCCAVAVLQVYAEGRGGFVRVSRSRKPEAWNEADVVVDVGGRRGLFPAENDGVRQVQYFDHHQAGGAGLHPGEVPKASFGLVWEEFGPLLVRDLHPQLDDAQRERVVEYVRRNLVAAVDASDTGFDLSAQTWYRQAKDQNLTALTDLAFRVPAFLRWQGAVELGYRAQTLSGLVAARNPSWLARQRLAPGQTVAQLEDEAFDKAVRELARPILEATVDELPTRWAAEGMVREAVAAAAEPGVVLLTSLVPWKETLLSLPEANGVAFVVYPGTDDQWMVQAVPTDLDQQFSSRRKLPRPWGGLRPRDQMPAGLPSIEEVTGVADAVFCHAGLWIAAARSCDGAMDLARRALNYPPPSPTGADPETGEKA